MVEDDFLIAMEVADILRGAGAVIVGPAGYVAEAIELLAGLEGQPDIAVLDLDLHGSRSYPDRGRAE